MNDAQVIAAVRDVLELSFDWIETGKREFNVPQGHALCLTSGEVKIGLIRKLIVRREPVTLTGASEREFTRDDKTAWGYRAIGTVVAGVPR